MIGMECTESSTGGGSPQDRLKPQLPPGFRFHPTDEELVVHYLKKKAAAAPLPVAIIADIDLYKFDPWELPGKASFGEEEWYFFSPRDRKYPNGARPNRAATSGYWKATGTDKPILASGGTQKVGVKKALVFYGGKPPKGVKTNWIMHEYRLAESSSSAKAPPGDARNKSSLRLDDWVLCRIYKKNNNQRIAEEESDKDGSAAGIFKGLPLPFLSHHAANSRSNARLLLQAPKHGGTASYTSLLDHDESFFEGLLAAGGNHQPNQPFAHLITMGSLPLKRSIASSTSWNETGGALVASSEKRLHDSSVGHVKDDGQTHFSIAGGDSSSNIHGAVVDVGDGSPSTMLAGHLPPGAHYHPQQESPMLSAALAEGGFRQPFQLHGMNWGT